jgi:uncharacterized protein YjbJ (UPF0337 family)
MLGVLPGLASLMLSPEKEEFFMDKNRFKGGWHEFKGELKRKWGQLTDDDLLEAEGNYEKFLGVVQKRYGDKRDEVTQWADQWYSAHEQEEIRRKQATTSKNQV